MFYRCLLASLLMLVPLAGLSQPADSTIGLQEITVTATRQPIALQDAPGRITLLGRDALDRSSSRNLAELLTRQAGLFTRQYGRGLASLTMRGSSASQTLILLDGMRLSDPQLGQIDLSLLPASLLESVEISHGGRSALYGSDGIGGAINLIPRRLDATPFLTEGSYGFHFRSRRFGNGFLQARTGRFRFLGAFDLESDPGGFRYEDPLSNPRETKTRSGNDRNHQSWLSRLEYAGTQTTASLGFWLAGAERGLPGPVTLASREERQWDSATRAWLSLNRAISKGHVSLAGHFHHSRLRYVHPQLQIDDTGRTRSGHIEASLFRAILFESQLTAGLSGGWATAHHPKLAQQAGEQRAAAFASITSRIGTFKIYPAVRLDVHFTPSGDVVQAASPSLGVNKTLDPSTRVRLKAGTSRVFRMPTLNDRFWQPGGNPHLQPETGWSHHAGATYTSTSSALHAESTVFLHHVANQIVWEPTDQFFWAPHNVGKVRSWGVETSLSSSFPVTHGYRLHLSAQHTFTHATDRTDPSAPTYRHQLRYTPRHQAAIQVSFHVPNFWIYYASDRGRIYFDLELYGAGRRFITADGSSSLPSYRVVNVQVRRSFELIPLTITLAIENLTREAYEVIKGYPMPTASYRLEVRLRMPSSSP